MKAHRTPTAKIEASEVPRYTVTEAARYLQIPATTMRSWVVGRSYSTQQGPKRWEPLLKVPDLESGRLSFSNLIEAHVLCALRRQFKVRMREIRTALEYAREALGVDRVLLSKELRATHGNVLLQELDSLINLGKGGQVALQEIFDAYLQRVEWDPKGPPLRIFPLTRPDYRNVPRLITIDPCIAFGRPILQSRGITTSILAERFRAGESITDLAEDYDLKGFEVEEAIRYEALATAA
ncbi:MAG TPA: DUF433 domain-containing protein [Thermoanaerobaculia bacterium]|nr:DUF433 domain-containing protein [Thermoanaerobaculia bacterium]